MRKVEDVELDQVAAAGCGPYLLGAPEGVYATATVEGSGNVAFFGEGNLYTSGSVVGAAPISVPPISVPAVSIADISPPGVPFR